MNRRAFLLGATALATTPSIGRVGNPTFTVPLDAKTGDLVMVFFGSEKPIVYISGDRRIG